MDSVFPSTSGLWTRGESNPKGPTTITSPTDTLGPSRYRVVDTGCPSIKEKWNPGRRIVEHVRSVFKVIRCTQWEKEEGDLIIFFLTELTLRQNVSPESEPLRIVLITSQLGTEEEVAVVVTANDS